MEAPPLGAERIVADAERAVWQGREWLLVFEPVGRKRGYPHTVAVTDVAIAAVPELQQTVGGARQSQERVVVRRIGNQPGVGGQGLERRRLTGVLAARSAKP